MGRNILTCLNMDAEGWWVGSIHDAIGPRLANTLRQLALSELVRYYPQNNEI